MADHAHNLYPWRLIGDGAESDSLAQQVAKMSELASHEFRSLYASPLIPDKEVMIHGERQYAVEDGLNLLARSPLS